MLLCIALVCAAPFIKGEKPAAFGMIEQFFRAGKERPARNEYISARAQNAEYADNCGEHIAKAKRQYAGKNAEQEKRRERADDIPSPAHGHRARAVRRCT